MTQQLACDFPELFAGYGVVTATLPPNVNRICTPSQEPGSMIIIGGTRDTFIPYWGGIGFSGDWLISKPATASFWADQNGCGRWPRTQRLPETDPEDGTSVNRSVYPRCQGGAVELWTVVGGGHTWPGDGNPSEAVVGVTSREFDASEIIWTFFEQN